MRRQLLTFFGLVVVAGLIAVVSMAEEPPAPAAPTIDLPEGRVRVEVLNAGGVRGMARDATRMLREIGFDVVDFGNASSFDAEHSEVVDRVGRTDVAQAVAEALGIDNGQSEPDPNLYVDVSVLLGSQWRPSTAQRADEEVDGRPWYDPRGWLGR